MIIIIHPNKLTKQAFFNNLINYLDQHEEVTLRHIKQVFSDEKNVDRQLESYINAGYIIRENRRYRNGFKLLDSTEGLELGQEVFVETESSVFEDLTSVAFVCQTTNQTNAVIIEERVDFLREKNTLESYFYKMRTQEPLSKEQEKLYAILGDVNPDYALKYMTSFLLKFARKEKVLQRRTDIFVLALQELGFIEQVEEHSYRLTMQLDKETLVFTKTDKS
ncbi:DUF1803 domain-containing protein [Streptococcus ovis]|uniref:DUF1803 domain-containing protein n=1 Tax=Streptococcus ovis TaxID=82806 RepID=UPI0003691851|nr:DUF1803 domain-containing protein [Streptococcus ovis]